MSIYYDWKKEIKDEELKNVGKVLRSDGVVIFPTETVYGIGGNALSENAINRIYEVKKRPINKAVNIFVKDKSEIVKYAEIRNELEEKIINNFMPGPITIILRKKESKIAKKVTCNNDTIGIRIPNNEIAKKILDECEFPIAVPSANISGKPSGVVLSDIIEDFKDKVDIFIDGGICKESISSTIVKVEQGEIVILREGSISKEQIERVVKV